MLRSLLPRLEYVAWSHKISVNIESNKIFVKIGMLEFQCRQKFYLANLQSSKAEKKNYGKFEQILWRGWTRRWITLKEHFIHLEKPSESCDKYLWVVSETRAARRNKTTKHMVWVVVSTRKKSVDCRRPK